MAAGIAIYQIDVARATLAFLHAHEDWQIDEYFFRPFVLTLAFSYFALRRWNEARRELAARVRAGAAIAVQGSTLREQAELLDLARDPVIVRDLDDRVRFWNRGAERTYGCSARDAAGGLADELVAAEYSIPRDRIRSELASTGFWEGEVVCRQPDGTSLVMLSRRVLRRNDGGEPEAVLQIDIDITERIRTVAALAETEHQLRQAQKMEAVGQLAGGVAHDFNNLLTVILGYAGMLSHELGDESPLALFANDIHRAGERAAALTRQLLAFSRKQILQPRVLDLNEVVDGMKSLLGRLVGEDVAVESRLEPKLWRVEADPSQIEQVVMNLAVNARDAMPRGGQLTIETCNVRLDAGYVGEHSEARVGDYALVTVSDSGVGMSAETLAHAFEPFFTTKEVGKGTGLGLSTVYGIVNQSGGIVAIDSELGRGTSFRIYLPRVEQFASTIEEDDDATEAPTGCGETILLVEDEEGVRELAAGALRRAGYTVIEAYHGQHALEVAAEHCESIVLLLTDMVMPVMGGRELARRLKRERPSTRVLFMSGYTHDAVTRDGALAPDTVMLDKPFSLKVLVRTVRDVLDTVPS